MITIDPPSTLPIPAEPPLSKTALTRFLNRARKLVDLPGDVEVLLTSDVELKRLNCTFRNKNKPTDILSFPAPPEISGRHAGDLAISLETAARQATQYGHSLPDELRILILHGLLHLSGLDHETDYGEMAARESELHRALKLSTSLIARSIKTGRHCERSEACPHLASARPAPKAKKRAEGPSRTSLGQRPRSAATIDRERAEGPSYNSSQKKRGRP